MKFCAHTDFKILGGTFVSITLCSSRPMETGVLFTYWMPNIILRLNLSNSLQNMKRN